MKAFFALLFLFAPLSQLSVAVEKESSGTKSPKNEKSFTLAVLPDTQFYCDTRLKLSKKWGNGDLRRYFFDQTRWVRDNQKRLNIAFLVHEGDIVQADAHDEPRHGVQEVEQQVWRGHRRQPDHPLQPIFSA